MKKLKLSLSNLESTELLSREQLKKIMGGDGSGDACEGKTHFDGYCRDANGDLLGNSTPTSCSSTDLTNSCSEYSNFNLHRSSCSCY